MKRYRGFYILLIGSLFSYLATAQETLPSSSFLETEVKVGEPVRLSVSYVHKPELRLLFPDSSYKAYEPFEWVSQEAFPTKTTNGLSVDSVVYTLRTFELDSVQTLELPVFLMNSSRVGDTQKVYAPPVRIKLTYALRSLDTLQRAAQSGSPAQFLKTDTRFQRVAKEFNYPYFIIGLVILVVVLIGFYLAFGKKIRTYLQERKQQKQYEQFLARYNTLLAQGATPKTSEEVLVLWKSYLQNLRKQPYTSYTAREIAQLHPEAGLDRDLKRIDRAVYGGQVNEETESSFKNLRQYAQKAYQEKRSAAKV